MESGNGVTLDFATAHGDTPGLHLAFLVTERQFAEIFGRNSYNSFTAQRNDDDSVTIAFGGDPDQPNFLPIVKGWNYIFRTYRPQPALLDGTWTYPEPEAADQERTTAQPVGGRLLARWS